MSIKQAVRDENTTIDDIARQLDSASPEARLEQVFTLDRAEQRRLYELAADAPPIDMKHFVGDETASSTEVRHHGRNTLPLPRKHKRFEKRFCRPTDGAAKLHGYNHSPSRRTVGPGYFVAIPTEGTKPEWEARGAVVVDYFQVPEDSTGLPEHWPEVVPNSKGLSRFVYNGTRDFMRRVSEHVSIGAAYKGEKSLDHYFVLVRDPAD